MENAKELIRQTFDKASKIWDWSFILSAIVIISMSIGIDVEINKVTIPGSEQFIRSWNDIMRNVYSIFLAILITWKVGMSYCNSLMGVSESTEEEQAGLATWMIKFVRLLIFIIYGGTITLYIFMLKSNEFQYVKDTNVGTLIITSLTIICLIFVFSFGVSIDLWFKGKKQQQKFKIPEIRTSLFTRKVKPKVEKELSDTQKELLSSRKESSKSNKQYQDLKNKYQDLKQKHEGLQEEHQELQKSITPEEDYSE